MIQNCGADRAIAGVWEWRTTAPWDAQALGQFPTFFVHLRRPSPALNK